MLGSWIRTALRMGRGWTRAALAGLAALFFASACGQTPDEPAAPSPRVSSASSSGIRFVPLSGGRAPAADACTFPAAYWLSHPSGWWHRELQMGGTTYSKEEQLDILGRAAAHAGDNGLVALGRELIAARLNVAAGASPSGMDSIFTQAEGLIGDQVIPPRGEGWLAAATVDAVVARLADFNEGRVGPGRCPE